jgi:hypothetical protein
VSCATPGNCTVAGLYHDQVTNNPHAFVADESGGTWGQAQALPGLEVLNASGHAEAAAISCRAPGNCATGGTFSGVSDGGAITESYVADERQGGWDLAVQVFGGRSPFNGATSPHSAPYPAG